MFTWVAIWNSRFGRLTGEVRRLNREVQTTEMDARVAGSGGEVRVDLGDALAVQTSGVLGAVVVPDEGDVDGRTFDDPGLVRPREEDVASLFDSLEHAAVRSATYALRRQEPDALDLVCFDHCASLLVPVRDEVGLSRHPAAVDPEERVDVAVAEVGAEQLAAEEGWVADALGALRRSQEVMTGTYGITRLTPLLACIGSDTSRSRAYPGPQPGSPADSARGEPGYHRQGNDVGTSYRSAIFYLDEDQRRLAEETTADAEASGRWPGKVVTGAVPERLLVPLRAS